MNWVRHGGSTTFETKSSYCWVARQGLSCYMAVARLGFKRHATTMLKSNLIWSIELGTAVAWRLKRALIFLSQSRVIKQTVSFSLMKSGKSSPNSDQHQVSPNNIHMLPREMVMRVNKMTSKEEMRWSVIKLSQLIL